MRNMEWKIMSCNLRVAVESDGINCFDNRKDRLLDRILREKPDLIGFQEATEPMRAYLRQRLTDYVLLGCGRNRDYGGEGIPVALRRDCAEVLSFETRWLSPTPTVAGSRYEGDQSECPRIYHMLRLRCAGYDRTVRFLNVHTDHMGSGARMLEVQQLLRELTGAEEDALILTGDFNAEPHAPEIRYITEESGALSLTDATASLGGTFHDFGRVAPVKIDYIFTNLPYRHSTQISEPPADGVYLSDHDPIFTYVSLV